MASLYLLIPVALIFCIVAIRLLLWAIDNGQYDDLDKEAWSVVLDDEPEVASSQAPEDLSLQQNNNSKDHNQDPHG